MDQALIRAQENLETMLQAVSHSFIHVREMLRRSANPRRADLQRRINEVNLEFIRLRANNMRHSFERNLARQEEDRRRRRNDSGSSTDSNNSDFDLDFYQPVDLWQLPTANGSGTDEAKHAEPESSSSANADANANQQNITADTPTTSASSSSTSHSSSSHTPTEDSQNAGKRKMPFSPEEAPPAKRSMATSTDDAYFHNQF